MWCLETIIQLNDKAVELAKQGRPEKEAFAQCSIKVPSGHPDQKRPKLKVEEEAA